VNEKSELKTNIAKLGISIVLRPKAYCEISGRGVDNIWGVSKIDFRKENAKLSTQKQVESLAGRVEAILRKIPLLVFRQSA